MANKAKKKKPVVKAIAKKVVKAKAKAKPKVTKKTAPKKTASKKKVVAKKTTPKKSPAVAKQKAQKLTPLKMDKKPLKLVDYSKAITPLADRLVIRVVQAEKITSGGIIIPDSVSTAAGHLEGEVLAVGHGAKNKKGHVKPLDVKIGDFVLFSEYSGTKVEFNSEELQIIKESDVMGIVQK